MTGQDSEFPGDFGVDEAALVVVRRHVVAVIECTGGVLNQRDKLSKQVVQARDIGEKVPGQEVRIVVVTSLKGSSNGKESRGTAHDAVAPLI